MLSSALIPTFGFTCLRRATSVATRTALRVRHETTVLTPGPVVSCLPRTAPLLSAGMISSNASSLMHIPAQGFLNLPHYPPRFCDGCSTSVRPSVGHFFGHRSVVLSWPPRSQLSENAGPLQPLVESREVQAAATGRVTGMGKGLLERVEFLRRSA